MNAIIPIESINPLQIFVEGGLDDLLAEIEAQATDFEPDVTTKRGRDEIISRAYKVTRCKPVIDDAGKELVADWKAKAKVVDTCRRHARDFLDNLRDRIRGPVTEYEASTKLADDIENAHAEALILGSLWEREKQIERDQEALRLEQERLAAERDQQSSQAQTDADVERLAEARIQEEQDRADTAEREAQEKIEQAEREAQEKIDLAAKEASERQRLIDEEIERKRKIDDARKADLQHQQNVNRAAYKALVQRGLHEDRAREVIILIASEKIPGVRMVY